MATVRAARFTALKAKVKAECQRRNGSGSVASYGGSAYDYTVVPQTGGTVLKEHRDKLTGPMSAINSSAVPATSGEKIISEAEMANMETRIAVWSARSKTDRSGSDCRTGCTGMCYTSCTGGCYGCGSGCPTGCSGCGSGCPTGCSGCGSGCPGSCSGCGSGCPNGCSGCGGSCSYGCGGCDGCDGCSGCGSGCPTGCSGCGSGCPTGCSSSCTGGCKGGCSGSCGSGCPNTCTENCAYNK